MIKRVIIIIIALALVLTILLGVFSSTPKIIYVDELLDTTNGNPYHRLKPRDFVSDEAEAEAVEVQEKQP